MKNFNRISLLFLWLFFACNPDSNEPEPTLPVTENPTTPYVEEPTGFVPCENGFAGDYPCLGYDLYAHIGLSVFDSVEANDNWGWTDSLTGKEYVLVGLDNGTAFVDISSPEEPVYLGKLPTATDPSIWRDIKVYRDHAYIVSEAPGHGMQVFDLTRLRDITEPGQTFTADGRNTSFGNAHNIAINEESGFAYVVGSQLYESGPIFFDLSDLKNPIKVGGYAANGYSHDAQIIMYQGPDANYAGKEIYMGSHSDGSSYYDLVLVDVTDKEAPKLIKKISYSNPAYAHQNWISEDHRYIFLGDEVDEINFGGRTRTLVYDVSNLDEPKLHHIYRGTSNAIDHNGYWHGALYYLANYTAGLRVIDVENIENNKMQEVGFFDTYPEDNATKFAGVWSIYPFFESGLIAINDINTGFYLVKKSEAN
ncbi:MAG: choice-of-anchor B family protein [Flavobacteriaceae bacterium]